MSLNPETYALCEAVADMATNFAVAETHPTDSRELVRLCIEWASDFEAAHPNCATDGTYIEAVDAYFTARYVAWRDATPRSQLQTNKLN